ncbi:MAG: sulfite exporter TauE/SafE family protein [Bacteroidetes bacterium]|nr:sulfite exporter TauE/SafE family protein [Bacteroidota bacterium]
MEVVPGFVLGFFGSVHCIGMCGPITLVLPRGTTRGFSFVTGRVLYNVGRLVTYATLGLAVGYLGNHLMMAGMQQYLSIGIGIALLVFVLMPPPVRRSLPRLRVVGRLQQLLKNAFMPLLERHSLLSLFLIGLVNGLLPCGFVYVALAGAMATGNELKALLFMAGFGAGTFPVMFGMSLLGSTLSGGFRQKLTAAVPVLTFVLGVLLILRGLSLGIPYVSPDLSGVGHMTHQGAHH